ncbi:MAG: domain S-box protein [Thermoleophilia bacterium]|nr:domain S-box protein [Thermoleophilia bacterium]
MQHFFDLSHDLLCIARPDGRFRQVNASWTRALGWTAEELTAVPFVEFVHPDDRDITDVEIHGITTRYANVGFRNRYRTRSGGYRWLDWRSTFDRDTGEIFGAARDVTDTVEMHERLTAREEMLTGMVASQLRIRDDEHRRIASELHDSAVQYSVAALMRLEALGDEMPGETRAIEGIRHELRCALDATRKVMHGLDPLDLGDLPLDRALLQLAEEMSQRVKIPIRVEGALGGFVDSEIASAVYRMTREALVNAGKHASASSIGVELQADDLTVASLICDDGKGVEASAAAGLRGASGLGLGLAFMRERACDLGGSLDIETSESGTTIGIRLPRCAPDRPSPFDA